MKHLKSRILLFLFVIIATDSLCQSLDNFDDVLSSKIIGKKITKKVNKDISERTYLGYIKEKNGNVMYYVVKEFLRIQAAVVYHGHSRILFFNSQKQLVVESILSMPYELPFKLKDNRLYFNYTKDSKKMTFVQDVSILPRMLCVEPTSCYNISSP